MPSIDICNELSQNFIDFCYEANSERAFPDARDGLKPGQRACLWEFYDKGYTSNKPHVKSAKVSGGVIANWWPHGDVAIYETFARMSQPWINNIPEVDWHGANGNQIIGSAPANQRYTEARLSKAIEDGMFQGIKKNIVPMVLNFSEDMEWPVVLPAIFPRLFVNGCQGIGVTIANTWLPHSLDEVCNVILNYVQTGNLDYNNLAPSFPSGGIIINKDEVSQIYKTGKGKVILRGKTEIKDNHILITELPYQVYVEPFIDSVKELIKKEELTGISDIYNKSDKKSLLIDIECNGSPTRVLMNLFNSTDLQKSYSTNQWALIGKTPKLLTLKEYIDVYLEHNLECIAKEAQFDLAKAQARKEIVDGLLKALENIDNIIALIKKSKSSADAQVQLINTYSFSENQAKAIVNMKLGSLANLEKIELEKECQELIAEIEKNNNILTNKEKRTQIFVERLTVFNKKYGKPRRTELVQINQNTKEEKEAAAIVPEDCVVIVSESGNIRRVPVSSYKVQRRNGKGVKNQDEIVRSVIRTNTIDNLMIFSSFGKVYRLSVDDVPSGAKGVPIETLVSMEGQEKFEALASVNRLPKDKQQYVWFITKNGLIKKTSLDEYAGMRRKTGVIATSFRDGDSLAKVFISADADIMIFTKNGMSLRFDGKSVSATGRTATGIKGINLNAEDSVVDALYIADEQEIAIFSKVGLAKRVPIKDFVVQGRGGKGAICYRDGQVVKVCPVYQNDMILVVGDRSSICIAANDIPIGNKNTQGNIVIKGNNIIGIARMSGQ